MSSSARARRPRRLRLAPVIVSGPSTEICGRVGAAITSGSGRASGTDVPWKGAAIDAADAGSGARITSDGGCDLRAWPRADQLDLLREGGAVATDSRASSAPWSEEKGEHEQGGDQPEQPGSQTFDRLDRERRGRRAWQARQTWVKDPERGRDR